MKKQAKFHNFGNALMAAQMLMFHYCQKGLLCTMRASKETTLIEVSVFHDANLEITPPAAYKYTTKEVGCRDGFNWSDFRFKYEY